MKSNNHIRRSTLAALLCCTLFKTAAGLAQDNTAVEAQALFREGVELYQDGDASGARVAFERAYRAQPNYRLLYNLAQVSFELLDYVAAQRYFQRYLDYGGDEIPSERREEVDKELSRLTTRIGFLSVETPVPGADVYVDDVLLGATPMTGVPVNAGARRLRIEQHEHLPHARLLKVTGTEEKQLRIALEPVGPQLDGAPRTRAVEARTSADQHDSIVSQPVLWTGLLTVLLGGSAGAFAYITHQADLAYEQELGEQTTRSRLDDLSARVETRALVTDVLLAGTVVSAVTTIILLATSGDSEAPAVAIHAGHPHLRLTF